MIAPSMRYADNDGDNVRGGFRYAACLIFIAACVHLIESEN